MENKSFSSLPDLREGLDFNQIELVRIWDVVSPAIGLNAESP